MSSYKFKHMALDDRITIQKALKEGKTFGEIGALLGKGPSTISKEIRGHFEWKNTGTRSRGYNPCKHRRTCTRTNICMEADAGVLCSHKVWNRYSYCSECANCLVQCSDFAEELARLDEVITPLIKQGQSIHQICANNADVIMVDERTVYNYIDSGILSVGNIDLPRKVR